MVFSAETGAGIFYFSIVCFDVILPGVWSLSRLRKQFRVSRRKRYGFTKMSELI